MGSQVHVWLSVAPPPVANLQPQNVHFNGPRAGVNFNDWMGGGDVLEGNLLANCVRESVRLRGSRRARSWQTRRRGQCTRLLPAGGAALHGCRLGSHFNPLALPSRIPFTPPCGCRPTMFKQGDHGPWNSWDRVPYITDIGMVVDPAAPVGDHRPDLPGHTRANASHPSITPLFRQIRNNFILGTYNTLFDIDTDDGSGYLQAYNNFFVYGGGGLKSFFGGRWQHHWENVYGYVGGNGCFWTGANIAFFKCVLGRLLRGGLHVGGARGLSVVG